MKAWLPYDNGSTIGENGTEDGIILRDEEFDDLCHATLEKCPRYHAITCGIYGAMVHTCFCDSDESEDIYNAIKRELAEFVCTNTTENEQYDFYEYFCNKYRYGGTLK